MEKRRTTRRRVLAVVTAATAMLAFGCGTGLDTDKVRAFDPSAVPGLLAWLDAADLANGNSTFQSINPGTGWRIRGGSGSGPLNLSGGTATWDAASGPGATPLLQLPASSPFSSNGVVPPGTLTGVSVYAVGRTNGLYSPLLGFSGTSTSFTFVPGFTLGSHNGAAFVVTNDSTLPSFAQGPTGDSNFHIHAGRWESGGLPELTYDGTVYSGTALGGTLPVNAPGNQILAIGDGEGGSATTKDVSEVFLYDRKVQDWEHQRLLQYLRTKYNLP